MKKKIITRNDGIEIQVTDTGSHVAEILASFKECQEGRCSCPTQEYKKIESLNIEQSKTEITLTVKTKRGQQIDVGEINKCLEYTENNLK